MSSSSPVNERKRHGTQQQPCSPLAALVCCRSAMTSTMCIVIVVLLCLQTRSLLSKDHSISRFLPNVIVASGGIPSITSVSYQSLSINNLRATSSSTAMAVGDDQCRFYLAESAIPHGGLGIFTAIGLHKGDPIAMPDICLYVPDMTAPVKDWMQMRTHTWGKNNWFGQYEGRENRGACEGVATTVNTMPDTMINTQLVSPLLPTNAGLHRATSPGAGSITHHYGIYGEATDIVTAGSEITINYGDWHFDTNVKHVKPERTVGWLREHGWCIDNIDIRMATDPRMGRGAFATRNMAEGQVVAPAPLQSFPDRKSFSDINGVEQLYVNYCLQPKGSTMLFFPYGQGVGLINHSPNPNVYLRWSSNSLHHASWLDLDWDAYWENSYSGAIILEVVALRPIAKNEELFLDYGSDWEAAYVRHVANWKPPVDADRFVYPADMDETESLRTVHEEPYADNLITVCTTPDWSSRKLNRTIEWREPGWRWWRGKTYCHILERHAGRTGNDVYTVSLLFDSDHFTYDPNVPREELYIDVNVPRRAIRFVEKPYMDDEHLPGAFRHPIEFPEELVPDAWRNKGTS